MPLEGLRNEARCFHFFDEGAKRCGSAGASAFVDAHGLLDDHEPLVEHAKALDRARIRLELLLDACRHFQALFHEGGHDSG